MKKGRGKIKGGRFEREICVKLSLWVSNGMRKDLFWRSAMSGGRSTVARKKGDKLDRQAGDITAIDPLGFALTDKFYFELKNYNDLKIDSFLISGTGILDRFWRKTRREASSHMRRAILIVKQDHKPTIVLSEPGTVSRWVQPIIRTYGIKGSARILPCEVHLFFDMCVSQFDRKGKDRVKLIKRRRNNG